MVPVSDCHILVVEDDEDTRFMLSALLNQAGYVPEVVGSIEGAVRLAGERAFDLSVVDKRFPDGDGAELCRRLKGLNPQVPIVMYSGLAYEQDREEGFVAGADAYVTKPNIEGLLSVVSDLLKGRVCGGDGES